jgi:hypothetical protein
MQIVLFLFRMIMIRLHYGEDRIKLEGFIEQKNIFNITKLSNLTQILPLSNLQPAPAKKVRKVKHVLYRCYLYN